MIKLKFLSTSSSSVYQHACMAAFVSVALSACDQHQPEHDMMNDRHASAVTQVQANDQQSQEGNKLADVAGQATLPVESTLPQSNSAPLPANAKKYVGRYHVHVPCSDPVAMCAEPEGQIDYVLSLLPDGTAYRKRVSLGRISIDERQNTKTYEPDRWEFDAQQKEIVLTVFGGGKLYYKTIDENRLKTNLDKILSDENGKNRKNLGENFVLPQKPRVLTKLP